MLIHSGNNSQGRYEREGHRNGSFFNGAHGHSIYNDQSKKVNVLNTVAYILGIPLSAWAAWLYIGGWKGNLIWILAASFWVFKLIRAIVKFYFEYRREKFELRKDEEEYIKDREK
jgi:hypothetical protein